VNVCIHAVAKNRNANERMWARGHWASLINQYDADFAFIGAEEDRAYYESIHELCDKDITYIVGYDLDTAILLMQGWADMLVCVNSAIMHFGVKYGVPLVAIVGGTPARIVLPEESSKVKFIEDPELKWWIDERGHIPRLNEIMPEDVVAKMNELELGKRTPLVLM